MNMRITGAVGRRIVGGVAALATVASTLVAAVALAPAAQATGGVTRIQVLELAEGLPGSGTSNLDVSSPSSATTYKRFANARKSSLPLTVTFTGGTASFTVNGGSATPLTSDVAVRVPIDTGLTAIAITFNDGNADTTYNVEIKRPWLITGLELRDATTDDLLLRRHVDDGNFDPLSTDPASVSLPHDVAKIKWKLFYEDPAGIPLNERWIWFHNATDCGGYDCASGELSQEWNVPIGTWTGGGPATQVTTGTGYDYFSFTYWPVSITRAAAYSGSQLSAVTAPGVTFNAVSGAPYTFRGLVPASRSTLPVTATFESGTATYSVDGGSAAPVTSGSAFTVPVSVGGTTLTITHTGTEGETTYTYRLVRPMAITGFEVADATTGDILYTKTGAGFDPTFAEYVGWSSGLQHSFTVPNSVASVKMRMFYDTPPAGYVGRWWFHNWTECDGECESGEWSRAVNLSVGSRGGGGPLSMCNISSTCTYGDWTYWSLEIIRASAAVSIGSVSVSGSAAVDQALTASANTVTAVPTATLAYKWQYADSSAGPWNDIPGATGRKYVVRRAMVGKVLRAEVTGTNGVSTPGTTASSATSAVTSIALAAPTAISAVAGDGSLLVSWTPPNDPDYTGGTATAAAGSSTETCTGTTSCLITGLTNGQAYTVSVVARAGAGAGEVTSPASSSITATPAVPTAPAMTDVTVSGTVTEGQRLTAVPGGLTGSPTPTLTYLWERSANGTDGWTAIPGGTRSTLRLGNSVAGTYIRVTATASTGVNPTVTRTSAAAGPVTSATEVLPDAELTITVPGAPSGQARDVAFDSQGYMYVVTGWSSGADAIMKFAPGATGSDAPLVVWQRGDDGSSLWGSGITVDANDNVWMADHNYRLWKLPAGAGPTDRPQLVAENPTIDRGWDIITDANGYIYFSEIGTNRVKVFAPDVELGDSPVRTIDVGGQAGSVAIAEDGSLIVGSSNTLKFFTPGPSGSNTPIRTLTPSDGCQHFYGIAVDADGRIYNSSSNCRKVYVWNPNAVALVTPIKVLDLQNDYGLMGRNPVTGDVYVAGIDRRSVVTWDRAALGMGPIPVVEAPRMGTVTTSVTGEVAVRGTLTGAYSGLTGLPAPTLASSWQIADSASGPWTSIGGQTGTTLDIASAYEGKYLRYSVTVSNSEGENTTSSTPVGPVAPRPARGIVRWIVGSNMQTETITDIEFLPGDRIATANQWANDDRIQVFGPTADGNASPVQSIRFAFAGGRQSGWGINVAPDGDIWGAYHGGWAVKVPTDADGSTTPTRALTGEAERVNPSVLDGARSLVEDANGYLYVGLHDSSRIRVFAPGASNTDAPIREISVWNRGLGIDIDGNLVVASNGYLRVYAPGASTNDSPIQEVSLGGNGWDLGIDGEQRIWVLVDQNRILVFNPHVANTSTPVYTISDDWATRTAGAAAIGVSKETDGLFAVATSDSIRTYDYSTLLPAVPDQSAPAIASVNVTGTVAFGEQLTAAATGVTGYPDSQLTYQWQRAEVPTGPWTDITAATGATYTPIALDELHYLRAKVTATNNVAAVSVASSATTRLGYASAGTPVSYLANVAQPWAMHLLPSGNLLVANRNYDVREFAAGAAFSDAPIRVITAAGYSGPAGVFQDSAGYLWINYEGQGRVVKLAGNAGRNATPLQVFNPGCSIHAKVVVDEDGYIYVPCWHEGMVRVFAPDATGDATPLRTLTGTANARAELDPDGTLTVVGNNYVRTYALGGADASTEPLTNKAAPFHLMDVTWDGKGNILLAGWGGGFRAYPLTSASYDGSDYVMNGLQMIREAWSTVYDTANDELYVGSYHGFVTKYDWDSVLAGDAVAPSRPSEFEVTTEDGEITATWTAPVEAYTAVEVYADAGSGTLTCRVTAPTSTCTLTAADGVVLDRQYRVWARAYNEGSASPDTDSIYVTPEIIVAPDPVTNLQATAGSRTFTVTWTASPGEVTEYEVTATGGTDPLVCTTTETQCVFDTDVVNGVTYSVTVRTIRRTESATSSPVTVTPQPSPGELPPGRVSGVAAEGLNGEITVTWSKPTGTITGYVATAQRTGETLTCQTDSADALECVIEGATNTATYSVTVVALNVDQGSPVSNPVSVTVIRREAPSVSPFTLTGTPQSGRTLRATGLIIGGFPVPDVTYRWESSASLEGPWIPVESGEEPSYDLGKVDVGRFIRLVVVAANGVGDNARRTSDPVGPVLNMAGGTESVARPITTFRATAGDARIALSWDEVKGVTADTYTVRIEGGGAVREVSVRGTLTRTVVTGVRNGTTYTVSVTATGHPTSKTRDLVVIPAGKLGPVREVRSVVAGTTVTVSWKRPQGTSPVGLYRVVLDAIKPSVRDREFTVKTTQVVARNLISGEQYRLRIVAINRVGSGQAYAAPRPVTLR